MLQVADSPPSAISSTSITGALLTVHMRQVRNDHLEATPTCRLRRVTEPSMDADEADGCVNLPRLSGLLAWGDHQGGMRAGFQLDS